MKSGNLQSKVLNPAGNPKDEFSWPFKRYPLERLFWMIISNISIGF